MLKWPLEENTLCYLLEVEVLQYRIRLKTEDIHYVRGRSANELYRYGIWEKLYRKYLHQYLLTNTLQ